MNRGYLALGLATVVAAIMVLYIIMARGDDAAARSDAPAKNPEPAPATTPRANATPTLPDSNSVRREPSGSATDYTIGDVRIRDHRSGEHAQLDVAPVVHAPLSRKIPAQLSFDISQKVRAIVAACATTLPANARGDKPRIEGQITIAIKDHQATVTSAMLQLRDVVGVTVDDTRKCVEQKSIGATTPSGDEPDLDGYGITLSIRLP
jgi:hypothetical protein